MNRNCLQYKRSGGIVTVSQDRMVMRFVCQKEAYMDTTRWRMTGPIYMASAVTLDGAIPTEKEDVILADTAYLPCLLLNPVNHSEAYPRMASLHNDLFDTPEYASMSPGLSLSPRRETSDSRNGFCYFDISSTDGSYGSALRPFDSPKRSHVASKLDTAGTRIPCRRTVCSAILVRSAAPVKIYWDAAASAATLDMWFEDSTKEFMDSFHVSLVIILPSLLHLLILQSVLPCTVPLHSKSQRDLSSAYTLTCHIISCHPIPRYTVTCYAFISCTYRPLA